MSDAERRAATLDERAVRGTGVIKTRTTRGGIVRHTALAPNGHGKYASLGTTSDLSEAQGWLREDSAARLERAAIVRVLRATDTWVDDLTYGAPVPTHGGVYAVAGIGNWIKIGRAANMASRLKKLQIGHPVQLRFLATLSREPCDERKIHARWAHLRGYGEWFRAERELVAFIRLCGRNTFEGSTP